MKKIILIISGYIILTSHFLHAESIRYGGESGWNNTLSHSLRQTEGWMGKSALTLAPSGRNPFLDRNSDIEPIDMLLLSEPGGLTNPPSLYDIEGNYRISQSVPGRSNTSIRPGRDGLRLFPSPDAMWSPGRIWGDFTLEFRLKPSKLREGEVFFSWEGRDKSGRTQSVTAQVKKRRLVWKFEHFFQKRFPGSLTFSLSSTPLVPDVWNHHRIRFKFDDSSPDNTGSSSGYLEYLIDGIPVDSMFTTHDGREGRDIFVPRIGELSDQPIHLAPDFIGYFDEFQLNSTTLTDHPAGFYVNQNASVNGKGRTTTISAGYPGSSLTGITARFDAPGLSQIRFFAQAFESESTALVAGFPDPGNPDWVELKMKAKSEDPMGFGNWYNGEPEAVVVGRYFIVGYVFRPDPARDKAPVLSVLDVVYAPRFPPSPPRGLVVEKNAMNNTGISWSSVVEAEVAGWWVLWGPRPDDLLHGMAWIPRIPGNTDRPHLFWTEKQNDSIIYVTVRASWDTGKPINSNQMEPSSQDALSAPSQVIHFRP